MQLVGGEVVLVFREAPSAINLRGRVRNIMLDEVLVPTDGSEHAELAGERAFELARELDADVTVLSVAEDALVEEGVYGEVPGEEDAARARAAEAAESRAARAEEMDVSADPVVKAGDTADTIVDFADSGGFDVVVMGTRGLGGVERMLLGSVTDDVVRRSRAPVLTVREGAAEAVADAR